MFLIVSSFKEKKMCLSYTLEIIFFQVEILQCLRFISGWIGEHLKFQQQQQKAMPNDQFGLSQGFALVLKFKCYLLQFMLWNNTIISNYFCLQNIKKGSITNFETRLPPPNPLWKDNTNWNQSFLTSRLDFDEFVHSNYKKRY